MSYKKWNFLIMVIIGVAFVFIASVNYIVDPFKYFSFQGGDYKKLDFEIDYTQYFRVLKAEHVKNFGNQYDAYLIGGSKAGSFRPEKLQELDGYRYYNMFQLYGNFYDYKEITRYLIENTDLNKIVLSISGGEVKRYMSDQTKEMNRLPAVVTGKSSLIETMDFLFKDVSISFDILKNSEKEKKSGIKNSDTGERVLDKYYKSFAKDPEAFTRTYVTNKMEPHLKRLFNTNKDLGYYQVNLNALKEIKQMCDENDVELMVIVAPSFIGEMSEHESTYYWSFMSQIAFITPYWDFSGYHDIDLNPYNFYNEGHFYYETADMIIDVINGKANYEGFGTYVSDENVYGHIEQRKNDYEKIRKEYLETGTVQLKDYEDQSRIQYR